MKVLFINNCYGCLSTGRIVSDLCKHFSNDGNECAVAYGRRAVEDGTLLYKIGEKKDLYAHTLGARLFDNAGLGSKKATIKFIKWAEEFNPDMLWIHNIHGYYINYELLFSWIKKRPNMKVYWTLHDCWAFTGHCTHFSMMRCEKWKTGCKNCPQIHEYPKSLFVDNSNKNYTKKKELFTGVKDLTLITPSQWLADLVKDSFLSSYSVEVHHNKIDETVFKPTVSDLRMRLGLNKKTIILGVASTWSKRKGLDDLIKLSSMLDDRYVVLIVGLNKKQLKSLPTKIIGMGRTSSTDELVKVYSMADIFVNPSKEETFGLTTLEATSCGTKSIVYKDTASEEVVGKIGGIAVEQSPEALYEAITGHKFQTPPRVGGDNLASSNKYCD